MTAASDIYSIGVMLYEALTGRVPFEADSPVTVALKQVSERPRPPSELNPAVLAALDAVVLQALAKDPANRFASAEEFLQALDAAELDPSGAALGDTPPTRRLPPRPAPRRRPRRRSRRRTGASSPRARIALLALILLLLAGALALFPAARRGTGRARADRDQQVAGRGRRRS